jgi:hypothetical protein
MLIMLRGLLSAHRKYSRAGKKLHVRVAPFFEGAGVTFRLAARIPDVSHPLRSCASAARQPVGLNRQFRKAENGETMNKSTKGALLASAVATLFLATAAMPQEGAASSSSGSAAGSVKCVGGNACKGQSACKSAQNDCKGQNACKGKGFVKMSTTDECTKAGGHPES